MQQTIQNFTIQHAMDTMTVTEFTQYRRYVRKLLGWSRSKWFNKLNNITPLHISEKIVLFKIYEQKEYVPTEINE